MLALMFNLSESWGLFSFLVFSSFDSIMADLSRFFFSFVQTNLQLLANCYLRNNQAYCAYHILKGILCRKISPFNLVYAKFAVTSADSVYFGFVFGFWYIFAFLIFFFFSLLLSEGAQMAQSRYLFALSCFRLDFLNEAEAALSPPNEPSAEVGD